MVKKRKRSQAEVMHDNSGFVGSSTRRGIDGGWVYALKRGDSGVAKE